MKAPAARRLAVVLVGAVLTIWPAAPATAAVPSTVESKTSTVDGTAAACGPLVTQALAEAPWALTRLRPDLAWPLTRGAGVTVAVIDSGVSADHPILAGKVLPGRDLVDGGPGQCDENGHGTLIAGIIAGGEGVSAGYRFHGVAPEATILPVRVLRDQRRSYETDLSERIATAVTWAVDEGAADVINLSLTTAPTPTLKAAIRHAVDTGVVVVAAAGNQGAGGEAGAPVYPAAYDGVIGVAGVDASDHHVASSTAGPHVDVAAPGVRISGPSPAGGGYLFSAEGGTSFATAYVAGVAALVRAYTPGLPPDQVAARITQTADHPPGQWNAQVGSGVVNPARAVAALSGSTPAGAGPMGQLAPPEPAVAGDRLGVVAAWVIATGAVAAMLVLVAVPVIRRGRERGWRASRF